MAKCEAFHSRLKEARKRKGYSQRELGQIVKIAAQTISGYERNILPTLEGAATIADALGVSVDWLLGRTDSGEATRSYAAAFVCVEQLERALGTTPIIRSSENGWPGWEIVFVDPEFVLGDELITREQILSIDTAPELKKQIYSLWRKEALEELKKHTVPENMPYWDVEPETEGE